MAEMGLEPRASDAPVAKPLGGEPPLALPAPHPQPPSVLQSTVVLKLELRKQAPLRAPPARVPPAGQRMMDTHLHSAAWPPGASCPPWLCDSGPVTPSPTGQTPGLSCLLWARLHKGRATVCMSLVPKSNSGLGDVTALPQGVSPSVTRRAEQAGPGSRLGSHHLLSLLRQGGPRPPKDHTSQVEAPSPPPRTAQGPRAAQEGQPSWPGESVLPAPRGDHHVDFLVPARLQALARPPSRRRKEPGEGAPWCPALPFAPRWQTCVLAPLSQTRRRGQGSHSAVPSAEAGLRTDPGFLLWLPSPRPMCARLRGPQGDVAPGSRRVCRTFPGGLEFTNHVEVTVTRNVTEVE